MTSRKNKSSLKKAHETKNRKKADECIDLLEKATTEEQLMSAVSLQGEVMWGVVPKQRKEKWDSLYGKISGKIFKQNTKKDETKN